MDIVGRNSSCHFHVVPPLLISDDIDPILLEERRCVKKVWIEFKPLSRLPQGGEAIAPQIRFLLIKVN